MNMNHMYPTLEEILSTSLEPEQVNDVYPNFPACNVLHAGNRLRHHDANVLEKTLLQNEAHLSARLALLGFYSLRQYRNQKWADRYATHYEWLIVHYPRGYLSYSEAYTLHDDNFKRLRTCWLRLVNLHPRDVFVLGNAAHFCDVYDSITSERLWIRARKADQSVYSQYNLARLYKRMISNELSRRDKNLLVKAVSACEEISLRFRSCPDEGLANARSIQELLTEIAELALKFNLVDEAMTCAEHIWDLKEFFCNEVLYCVPICIWGRVSLSKGKVEQARGAIQKLIDENDLNLALCFDPVSKLANALLRAQQTDIVIRYVKSYVHDSDVTLRGKTNRFQSPAKVEKRIRQLRTWLKRAQKGKFSELVL